jgi:hypothetical protein
MDKSDGAAPPVLPRYPVYVPSRGRYQYTAALTARMLLADGVPFRLVVEPQEAEFYEARYGPDLLLVLPYRERGNIGLISVRNWIKRHATLEGHKRHWQLDDNIRRVTRRWHSRRIPCSAGLALRMVEELADRYENVAVAGMQYEMFLPPHLHVAPFIVNDRVFSNSLVLNSIPQRWRSAYNDDTDICLQVLSAGWCTLLVNAFCVLKTPTMKIKGGNTTALYQGDGRLKMARALERLWPGVVETRRRFQRPQHVVKGNYKFFTNALIPAPGFDPAALPAVDEWGQRLVRLAPIRSPGLRRIAEDRLREDARPPAGGAS